MKRGAALTAGLVAALAAAPAAAQLPDANARGFDAVPQKATPLSSSAFVVEGARAAPVGSWHAEFLVDWNVQILAALNGDQKSGNFIPWRVDGHLLGAWTLLPFLELGGDLQVTFAQGDNFEAIAGGFPPFNTGVSGGLGDIRLVPRLFTPASWKLPVDLAIVPELRFPTGKSDSFLGGNGVIFAPRANIERSFGPVRLLLNDGLRYRSTGRFINLIVENELTGGGAVVWTLPSGSVFRRPELIAETTFSTPLSQPFAANVGSNSASATTPWEFLLGARAMFGKHWGGTLAMGRGIASDAGYGREAFRLLAGIRYEFEPEPAIKDRDHDGVPDDLDKCPDEPGDGPDGCPDLDWDGIPDPEDKCPDQPGPAENDGCPVTGPLVTLESDRVRLNGSVHFDYDKAIIKPESFPLLDEVVGVLSKNPQLKHVRVEGHTDNKGTAAYNLDLSKRRAASVVEYLVQHGIDRKRLVSAGYGFERPIADNATALGRAKNRRVEFKLLDDEAKTPPPK